MKRLSVVLVSLLLAVCAGARITKGTYYYFRGEKVPLYFNSEKFTVLVPSGSRAIVPKGLGVTLDKRYMSIGMDVHVFQKISGRLKAKDIEEVKEQYGWMPLFSPATRVSKAVTSSCRTCLRWHCSPRLTTRISCFLS